MTSAPAGRSIKALPAGLRRDPIPGQILERERRACARIEATPRGSTSGSSSPAWPRHRRACLPDALLRARAGRKPDQVAQNPAGLRPHLLPQARAPTRCARSCIPPPIGSFLPSVTPFPRRTCSPPPSSPPSDFAFSSSGHASSKPPRASDRLRRCLPRRRAHPPPRDRASARRTVNDGAKSPRTTRSQQPQTQAHTANPATKQAPRNNSRPSATVLDANLW